MARRDRRRGASPIVHKAPERKRSFDIPWLTIGAVALISLPVLHEVTREPMLRNHYTDRASCECDYQQGCGRDSASGSWAGPWYAQDPGDRRADDPGAGTCRRSGGSGYYGGYGGYGYGQGRYPPTSVEQGYRGGFGSTGRVHSARS
ncbi:hypothetical protein [Lysobacter panacisoli]|uniref:Uncharacterized protein n=1 Tax=Lysobacter panacisoli TaxID=1255263 RepID=A0ABP9LSK6_9GAMM|nr:hypothetical protein [Lysobacter panacisoli]